MSDLEEVAPNALSTQYGNLTFLDPRGPPQTPRENHSIQRVKRSGATSSFTAKRRKGIRPGTPLSEIHDSPRLKRVSTPLLVSTSPGGNVETGSGSGSGSGTGSEICNMISQSQSQNSHISPFMTTDSYQNYGTIRMSTGLDLKSSYLFTPPSTDSEYSSKGSTISDAPSVASTAHCLSSPPSSFSDDRDEIESDLYQQNGTNTYFNSPEDLTEYPANTGNLNGIGSDPANWKGDWDLFPSKTDGYTHPRDSLDRYSSSDSHVDKLHAMIDIMGTFEVPAPVKVLVNDAIIQQQFFGPTLVANITTEPASYATESQPASFTKRENAAIQHTELESKLGKDPFHISPQQTHEKPEVPANMKPTNIQEESNAIQSSLDMYLKKGTIEDWSNEIPYWPQYPEPSCPESPSTSIVLATAEDDLEGRVSRIFCDQPNLGKVLMAKLKDELTFILPLFCEDEESSPFESGYTYSGYERGAPRQPASSSAPSTTGSKSTTGTSITTPATSADSGRGFAEEDDDEELPSRKRPRKQNYRSERQSGNQGRRRLRCHFHSKSPNTHCLKICILNGWLSIHNLRGHYSAHHTVIRCHKCFTEFDKKTEKNHHQRICIADGPAPSIEVIDCDKTDEIEEVLSAFRTWQLDDEQDQEMKSWIVKYKAEFVINNMTIDEAYDSRELAKWYRIWRTLFPSHQTAVPSPFQDASFSAGDLRLERWLTMLQTVVESQAEQNDPPPADLQQQIEYYKAAIRTVNRIANDGSTAGPSSETSQPINRHSESNASFFANNGTAEKKARMITPEVKSRGKGSLDQASESRIPGNSTSKPQLPARSHDAASPHTSLMSPYSIETRGAFGGSPTIPRSTSFSSSAGAESLVVSSPARSLEVHSQPQPALTNVHLVPTSPMRVESLSPALNTNTMMLPPPRKLGSPAYSRNNPRPTLQHYQPQSLHYPVGSPGIAVQETTAMLEYPSLPEDQGDHLWQNTELSNGEDPNCRFCMDLGYVMYGSEQQVCLLC